MEQVEEEEEKEEVEEEGEQGGRSGGGRDKQQKLSDKNARHPQGNSTADDAHVVFPFLFPPPPPFRTLCLPPPR